MDESVVVTPAGDRVDTAAVTTAEGVVHRQRISIADDAAADAHAAVTATPPAGDAHGLVTRNIPSGVQHVEVDAPVSVEGADLAATVAKLTEAVEAMQEMLAYQIRATRDRTPMLEPPFARDANGSLRAVLQGGSATTTAYFGASNTVPAYWSTGAPAAMDERQVMVERSLTNVQLARQRWSFAG